MTPIAKALLTADYKTIREQFAAQKFEPPKFTWNPKESEIELPELKFLLRYWQGLVTEGDLPHFRRVDALGLVPCLGYLMVIDVGEQDFSYRLYGTKIAEAAGFDMTGKTVSAFTSHHFLPQFFAACYQACIARRECLFTQHQAPADVSVYFWTRLILPLRDDSGGVARFLVGSMPGPLKRKTEG